MNIKKIIYSILFLGFAVLYFGGSATYAQVCRGHATAAINGVHQYTCQNPSDKALRGDITGGPCGQGFKNTWPAFTCPSPLICHICEKLPVAPVLKQKGESCNDTEKCVNPEVCDKNICVDPVCTDTITTNCTPPGGIGTNAGQGSSTGNLTEAITCNTKAGEVAFTGSDGKTITCACVPKPGVCCGVKLNTNVPFIGKCITMLSDKKRNLVKDQIVYDPDTLIINGDQAFPRLMLGLTKILVTVILLGSFIAIIVAGVMIAVGGADEGTAGKGKALIGSVIVGLALLGTSGIILRLINPNFFG